MKTTLDQLQSWIISKENERLEFKEARNDFSFENLVKYCAAIANEGGGRLILGVSNRFPRKIVGSNAFPDLEQTKFGLLSRLHLRIDAEAIQYPGGRVVVFHIPSRPIGVPISYEGAYWMRSGESTVPMTADLLKRIFEEAGPDFSGKICPKATIEDLDVNAIEQFRNRWHQKSKNPAMPKLSIEQLLKDAELLSSEGLTYAALILLGTHAALGKYLPQAEIIFEYRSGPQSGPAAGRIDYRQGFLGFMDDLWKTIDLRNDKQHFQQGLIMRYVPTFNEVVVREALLNAVSHRDYGLPDSIFIRQYPRHIQIVSPGGFPPGISLENILWENSARNRRIAEVFAKCGLVERSGQGVNRMFEESIKESKAQPDFSGTDAYRVTVTLRGDVQDPKFVQFLEKVSEEQQVIFSTNALLVLDLIHRERPIPQDLRPELKTLLEQGIIERIGHGRGIRYILSRKFYHFLGQKGTYTRKIGLDRETNKELLFKHIQENAKHGSRLQEMIQVLPAVSRAQVQLLLGEMERANRIHHSGRTNAARWYPGHKSAGPAQLPKI